MNRESGSTAGATVAAGAVAGGTASALAFTGVNLAWEVIAAAVLIGVGGTLWRLVPRRTA